MKAILDRLNTLAELANVSSGGGQLPVAVLNKLREYHIVATNRAGLLAEMQSLFQAQIPELRKDMGVKFEAGPELSAQGQMIGDPNIPGQALKGIFARQMAIANLGIQRRELAQRALYPGQAQPLSVNDYHNEENKLYANLTNEMQEQVKAYGGYTPQTQAPLAPPPKMTGGSAIDAIKALLRHLGGAADTQPTPQTQAPGPDNATEVWDVDASGKPIRVQR